MLRYLSLILLVVLCAMTTTTFAQDDTVTVPDLTGLTIPQAAAELNRSGLRLGNRVGAAWTEAANMPQNTVGSQSIAPGQTAPYGTTVDITVLTTSRVILLYDDNDITLINQTGTTLSTSGLTFSSGDGSKQFAASEWAPVLGAGDCGQLWAVTTRRAPKRLSECGAIQWRGTHETVKHFWTELAGVREFSVVQNGVARVTCPAAPAGTNPIRCDFFVASGGSAPINTPYLYFVYTADQFSIVNTSSDRWMPLDTTPMIAQATQQVLPAVSSVFSDATIVADVSRLAPGQCLLITIGPTDPPQPCDVAAVTTISVANAFWRFGFLVDSVTDNDRDPKSCPAADAASMTVCILTR